MQSMDIISWIAIIERQQIVQLRSGNINCNYVFIFQVYIAITCLQYGTWWYCVSYCKHVIAIFTWKNKYSSFLSWSMKGVVTDDNDKDDEQRKLTKSQVAWPASPLASSSPSATSSPPMGLESSEVLMVLKRWIVVAHHFSLLLKISK